MKEKDEDFLSTLMGNPARARLLRVFIFNQSEALTVDIAGKRAGVSLAAAEREIKALEKCLLISRVKGSALKLLKVDQPADTSAKKKTKKKASAEPAWQLNIEHEHIGSLAVFINEISPIRHDNIVSALKRVGKLATVILSGAFVGDPSRPADLLVAADTFDERRLEQAVRALEPAFGREIRYAAFLTPEFRYRVTIHDRLIRDTLDYPHMVIFDRTELF